MTEMISDDSISGTMISIRIKTTTSSKEIALTVPISSNVDEIKRLVMIELGLVGQEDNKYVRLISCGKMLADGNTLATYNISNGAFIHAVISDKKPNSVINNTTNGIEMTTMNSNSNSISMNNLHGLDVLLAEGLSVDEVAAIRSYFRNSIDEYAGRDERLQIRDGENNVAYRARIEEAWMNAQPPHSEFILNLPLDSPRRLGLGNMSGNRANPLLLSFIRGFVNQNNRENMMVMNNSNNNNNNSVMLTNDESLGSTRDFVFGIFFGVFFGFMSLLCVWDHNIPFRQKVGILIGVMIQIIMGTLVNSPNAASPPTNTNSNSNSNNNNNNSVNNAINGLEPLPAGNRK